MESEANIRSDIEEIINAYENGLILQNGLNSLLSEKDKEMLRNISQLAWNRGFKKGWVECVEFGHN